MRLAIQIALGIFLAGLISWIFWLAVFAAGAKAIVDHLPPLPTHSAAAPLPRVIIPIPAPHAAQRSVVAAPPPCVNYVQMANGQRHCLETIQGAHITLAPK